MRKGFTIEEVLITVLIMVVIMIITIPSILEDLRTNEYTPVPKSNTIFIN